MWFFCLLHEERLHPLTLAFMVSLVTHCDISWNSPSVHPLRAVSGLVVSYRCPPPSHLVTSQTGAGWWQSWKYYQQIETERERVSGREPWGVISVFMSVHVDLSAMSEALRANALSLLLPILYLTLILSPSLLLQLSPAVMENCWTESPTLSRLRQALTDCFLSRV